MQHFLDVQLTSVRHEFPTRRKVGDNVWRDDERTVGHVMHRDTEGTPFQLYKRRARELCAYVLVDVNRPVLVPVAALPCPRFACR